MKIKDGKIIFSSGDTIEDLRKLLTAHKVPISLWGKKESRTIEDLYLELMDGKSELRLHKLGHDWTHTKLFRHLRQCSVRVFHKTPRGPWHVIIEKWRELPDGTVKLPKSLRYPAKKILFNEDPIDTAKRVLTHELPFDEDLPLVSEGMKHGKDFEPRSYPGLPENCEHHIFATTIDRYMPMYESVINDTIVCFCAIPIKCVPTAIKALLGGKPICTAMAA